MTTTTTSLQQQNKGALDYAYVLQSSSEASNARLHHALVDLQCASLPGRMTGAAT
ncbi:MAG: hypothetical protein ACK40T_02870 [Akkermansiaceae bacterium]